MPEILSPGALYVTAVIVVMLGFIATEHVRADLGALIILLALWAGQIITPTEAISGFSRPAVITILGLFIITAGLDYTGVTHLISDRLVAFGAGSEARLTLLFMAAGALLSLFMNNIAAGAVLLPAAVSAARRTNISPSKLLMPMAFGTLLGGMATFFTTANIVVSNTLADSGLAPFGILDFTPTGGVVCLAGIAYMMTLGRRLLPLRSPAGQVLAMARTTPEKVEAFYQLKERLWEAVVEAGSPLAGKTIQETEIGTRLGITIIAIWHNHEANLTPTPDSRIEAGDVLLIAGREDRVTQLDAEGVTLGRGDGGRGDFRRPGVALFEAIVAPHSNVEDRSLKDLNFRKKYGITAVALWREGRSYRTDVGLFPLKFGDSLLMVGPVDRIAALKAESDFLILEGESTPAPRSNRRLAALLITAFVLILSVTDTSIIPVAMLLGGVLMVLTGCLTMEESYRAIEWRAIFLIAGMLPISIAMTRTGLATFLGQGLVDVLGTISPLAVVAGIYLLTVLLGQVMSGQVTAVVVAPIAISAALQMGFSPHAACIAVAIGCSTSFLTPIAHPVNVLMMAPGGYKFSDFPRVGIGLVLVCLVALMIALPLFWQL